MQNLQNQGVQAQLLKVGRFSRPPKNCSPWLLIEERRLQNATALWDGTVRGDGGKLVYAGIVLCFFSSLCCSWHCSTLRGQQTRICLPVNGKLWRRTSRLSRSFFPSIEDILIPQKPLRIQSINRADAWAALACYLPPPSCRQARDALSLHVRHMTWSTESQSRYLMGTKLAAEIRYNVHWLTNMFAIQFDVTEFFFSNGQC